jgi:hypothetical protein
MEVIALIPPMSRLASNFNIIRHTAGRLPRHARGSLCDMVLGIQSALCAPFPKPPAIDGDMHWDGPEPS